MPQDPAILRTSRLLRQEAIDVYKHPKPTLTVESQDCDVTKVVQWLACAEHHSTYFRWDLMGKPVWNNLLVWLESAWKGECPGLVADGDDEKPWIKAVSQLFDVSEELQDRSGLSWQEAKPVLEKIHLAMATLDPSWT